MKTKNISRSFILLLFSLFVFSCNRAQKDTTQIKIQLNDNRKLDSKFLCTECLKVLVVNVDGPNLTKIVRFLETNDYENPTSEITGEVTIEVPSGAARRFQVMGLYFNSTTNTRNIHYGSVTTDLTGAGPVTLNVPVTNAGQFIGGGIVGRYLTGVNSGPTGLVSISFSLSASSDISMEVEKTSIINGWFNFFASETFPVTAKMDDGTILFNKVKLDDLVPANGSSLVTTRGRIRRSHISPVYRYQGSWQLETELEDFVYGFFGDPAYTTGKKVCFENMGGPYSFSNLSTSNTGSPPIYYSHDLTGGSASSTVYGIGGSESSGDPTCAGGVFNTRYQEDKIHVGPAQLNGQGNDTARGMLGSFTYVYQGGSQPIGKFMNTGTSTIKLIPMPGIFSGSGTFDGGKVYYKANGVNTDHYDSLECNSGWLANNGFSEVTYNTAPVYSAVSQDFTFALAYAYSINDTLLVCPTISGNLANVGGSYLGAALYASFDISPSAVSSDSSNYTLQIRNVGTGSSPFLFKTPIGISNFTYSDVNCGSYSILSAGSGCSVQVSSNSPGGSITFIIQAQENAYSTSNDRSLFVNSF